MKRARASTFSPTSLAAVLIGLSLANRRLVTADVDAVLERHCVAVPCGDGGSLVACANNPVCRFPDPNVGRLGGPGGAFRLMVCGCVCDADTTPRTWVPGGDAVL